MKNVLLITADMISARNFGCYGDPASITPNVDKLAARGVRFDQAYCAATPCIPARVSMMSGLYAHTHGKMAHLKMPLNPRPALLPELFTSKGYQTGLVGKTHWWPSTDRLGCKDAYITIDNHLTPELGENDAYIQFLERKGLFEFNADTWDDDRQKIEPDNLPLEALKVNWTGDTAFALLEKYASRDEPFFLYCSFVEPHGPGSVQTDYLHEVGDMAVQPIIGRAGEHENKPPTQRRAVEMWSSASDHERMQYRLGVYASLSLVDLNIGKLLDTLDRLKLWDDTIVIFLTDHGDLMYDHGCIEKTFLYETAINIPFIVAGGDIPQGETRNQLVSQIDLLPTALDFAGVDAPDLQVEGRSVRPIIEDESADWREMLFCEVEQSVHLRGLVDSSIAKMLRTGEWKYIFTLVNGGQIEEELYNLDDDPDELYNRAGDDDQQARIREFRDEILKWLVRTEVNRLHPAPPNHYPVPRVKTPFV